MTVSEKKAEFVRNYLSPMLAAAKDDKYHKWSAEYMSGEEAQERFHSREDVDYYSEVVVCTVVLDDGDEVHYYCNVSCDSLSALVYDVMKVVSGK